MARLKTFSLIAACLLCHIAFAETPNKVIVFGDSASDTGNLFIAFGFPPPPYADGRFSDGPVWVEYLAGDLGAAPPAPSLLGGTNFAWAGAESINNISTIGVPGVGLQVSEYLGGGGGSAAENALHIVWAGANDILQAGNFDGTSIAANVAEAANRLAAGGAQHILVVNQMNLGRTPALANGEFDPVFNPLGTTSKQFKKTAKTFNRAIKKKLKTVACANPGAEIMLLDAADLLRDVVQRPWRFGFQDVTTPAILGGDPATSLWWDSIHPTSAFHQILADEALAVIEDDDDDSDEDDDSDNDHCEDED